MQDNTLVHGEKAAHRGRQKKTQHNFRLENENVDLVILKRLWTTFHGARGKKEVVIPCQI